MYATPTARVTDRPFEVFIGADFDNSLTRANQFATLTYSLIFGNPGSIPGQLTFRAHDADLAVLHERFDNQDGQPFSSVDEVHFPVAGSGAQALFEPFSQFSLDPGAGEYGTARSWSVGEQSGNAGRLRLDAGRHVGAEPTQELSARTRLPGGARTGVHERAVRRCNLAGTGSRRRLGAGHRLL